MRINTEKRFLISLTRSISNAQMIRNSIYLVVFDLESSCIPEEKFENSDTTTWIGKHVPISVSISSNLISMPIFLCNSNPRDLVESFIDAVEATQSKAQMKLKFLEVETAIKSKLTRTLECLDERRCRNQRVLKSRINVSNRLSSRDILNVTATYYQCLDLIAQNTTST